MKLYSKHQLRRLPINNKFSKEDNNEGTIYNTNTRRQNPIITTASIYITG